MYYSSSPLIAVTIKTNQMSFNSSTYKIVKIKIFGPALSEVHGIYWWCLQKGRLDAWAGAREDAGPENARTAANMYVR